MTFKLNSSLTKKVNVVAAGAAALCALGIAAEAQAAQLYATDVVYYNNNNDVSTAARTNINHALGSHGLTEDSANGYANTSQHFLSLGNDGRAVFNFGQDFSGDVTIWETTWGARSTQSDYDERIDIYYGNFDSAVDWDSVANDLSQWTSAGEILNIADDAYNTASGASNTGYSPEGIFNHVLLVDKSRYDGDGFDVNAIAVQGVEKQEVPEPTALAGLLMVGALGIQSRRKRNAAA
ncbi:MAG: PEP-CTERM sorting domain-containing protein [Phormidesmis sp.]